jgi:PAS domain S-box-containing protein
LSITARIAAVRPGRLSIRAYVAAIIFAVLIPALLFAGWTASLFVESVQTGIKDGAKQEAREITAALDREIVSTETVLTALASSPYLETKNFEAFYGQARALARMLNMQIVLRNPRSNQQIVNTALPWGAALDGGTPATRAEDEEELLRLGRAGVSGVFYGPLVKRSLVAVMAPVYAAGKAEYVLSVGYPLERFADILKNLNIGPDLAATIIDRRGVIVARSQQHSEFAGKPALYPVPDAATGKIRGTNRQGVAFHWFLRRSDATGWTVSVGVPDSVLNAPRNLALASFGAASVLLFGGAIALAYYWGGRLSASVGALGIDRKPTREEFQILFDSAPNGVLVLDSDGLIALANARVVNKFGYDHGDLIGKPAEMLLPPRFRGAHSPFRKPHVADTDAHAMGAGRELFGQRKDNREFPIEVGLNPITTAAGDLLIATVVDISRRKVAEQRVSSAEAERDDLRRRFMNAQERERLRLAHELHDQTGQSLTAALLELKGIEVQVRDADRSRLRVVRQQMEDMGKTLHRIAWELRPASIDELGLANALANYLSEWNAQYGIETDFHCTDANLDDVPDDIRTAIYRVTQEALTNIAKHASGATSVSVVIERVQDSVRLMIDDNGCGFDAAQLAAPGSERSGLGLAGMRERLALVGGELEIETSKGAGTAVFGRIPLPGERRAA